MQSKLLTESEKRLRAERLSKVLRAFGLVDRFGLSELICTHTSPSRAAIAKAINSSIGVLNPGITSEYLTECVLAELAKPDPHTQSWLASYADVQLSLDGIPTGRSAAARYHKHVFELLVAVFDGILSNGRIEQEINEGRGRIDIAFDNTANEGSFYEVRTRQEERIPSIVIPIECKNISSELANAEFDQLSGRLNPHRGMLGILVCRHADKSRIYPHCKDRFLQKREAILVLDDGPVRNLVSASRNR